MREDLAVPFTIVIPDVDEISATRIRQGLRNVNGEVPRVCEANAKRLPNQWPVNVGLARGCTAERGRVEGADMRVPTIPLSALLLASLALQCGGTSSPTQPSPSAPAGPYRLVWSDEFDGTGVPDTGRWMYDVGGDGWGNRELQFYTDGRLENARVEGGRLVIEARRESWQGSTYTSARLNTRQGWAHARVEVRAKLPSGRGTWPAIWMLPVQWTYGNGSWPDNGEIDIMEHVGFDPDVIHASVHTAAYNHVAGTQKTARVSVPGARDDFHLYAIEWTPQEIRAFVDDRPYFTFANERLTNPSATFRQWPFDKDFRVLLNIAVGGNWGGQQGVDESIWPQRMEIDYVRVHQRVQP